MAATSPGDESEKLLTNEYVIVSGCLQFCIKGSQEMCCSLNCAILPGNKLTLSEWTICCTPESEMDCQHVTYHKLIDLDESLSTILARYSKSSLQGLIIINSTNSVSLSDDFVVKEEEIFIPAVYVVSLEDGKELEKLIGVREKESVLVKIQLDRNEPMDLAEPLQQMPPRKHSHSKMKLTDLLEKHLYADGKRIIVSANQAEFQLIFSCFHHYEKQGKSERDPSGMDKVIHLLTSVTDETFNQDFLFHLLLAYRFKVHRSHYGNSASNYVDNCVNRFEAITDVKAMTNVLSAFIHMGDFEVQFKHETVLELQFKHDNLSVFRIFFDMTLSMLRKSVILHQRTGKMIYHRILWIVLRILFGLQVNAGQSTLASLWKSELLCEMVQKDLIFSEGVLEEFSKGFGLIKALHEHLPEGVHFDYIKLAEFLVPSPLHIKRIYVSHIKYLMEASGIIFCQRAKQLQAILEKIRHNFIPQFDLYRAWGWEEYSEGGTRLTAYQEALNFLEYMFGCISELSDEESDEKENVIKKEIMEWIKLLVDNVRLQSDDAVEYFKMLQSKEAAVGFSKKNTQVITELIHVKGVKHARSLKAQQFCTLFSEMTIWKFEFVEEFLNNCEIVKSVSLKDSCWIRLLKLITNRFQHVPCKKSLIDLMKRISVAYETSKRESEFINDLIHLDVPNLFLMHSKEDDQSIQELFVDMLCDFIRRNGLKNIILGQVISIMELVRSGNHLQSIILAAIKKEIVSDINIIEKLETSWESEQIVDFIIDAACESLNTLSQLTEVDKFYWHFISSCCKHIQPSAGKLGKLTAYSFAIDKLGTIFQQYCIMKNINESVTCEIPQDTSNTDIKDYFSWIYEIQAVIDKWREKFFEDQFNYDEILMLTSHLSTIKQIATAVKADLVFDVTELSCFRDRFSAAYADLWSILVKGNKEYGWCTIMDILNYYDTELSHTIQSQMGDQLLLVRRDSVSDVDFPQQEIQIPYDLLEQKPTIIFMLGKSVTLKLLLCIIADLNLFLEPILEQVDFLVYFHLHNCALFKRHLMSQINVTSTYSEYTSKATTITLALPAVSTQASSCDSNGRLLKFAAALRNTREFILSIINGTAKYEDIFFKEESMQKFDAERELEALCGFSEFKPNEEGKEGIKHMLELCQYSPQILKIPDICSQFQLVNCKTDAKLEELMQIVNKVEAAETRAKITGKIATEYMRKIREILKFTNDSVAEKSLKLFAVVANCGEFYKFIKKKEFINDGAAFSSQVELITAQLQHEDYNETVLNHLTSAFKYISPFLNSQQNFSQLMTKISRLCREGAGFGRDPQKYFCQLETVNSNITMIQLWFSRAEGDTLENVSKELKRIMENGHFKVIIKRKQIIYISKMDGGGLDECHSKLVLHCVSETWNNEQIDDFVRKLGFLESQTTDVNQAKSFQQLYQIAQKYYQILLKLRDLGHSEYVEKNEEITCSTNTKSAKEMVANAERMLENWRSRIRDMYNKYDKLLFFSVPKILCLHKILVTSDLPVDEMVDEMAHEIGVLFENDLKAIGKLKIAIRTAANTFKSTQSFQDKMPFKVVGKYLAQLCKEKSIKDHLLCSRNQPSKGELFQEMIHFAPNYDNGKLLHLLIKIYNGVPESYEVFQCDKNTSEEDLKLFLNRASKFRSRTFAILEINMLPYELQELILQHHLQEAGKTMEPAIHLHYIETAISILHEMPWIVTKDHMEDGPDIRWEDAKDICKKYVNKGNINYDVELVYGCPGDGKTHYIRKQLYGLQTLTIAVNESFTPLNAILKLRSLPRNKCCKIFFNFTIVNTTEKIRCKKFMNILAWFFFKLLVFEYIEDLETGKAFRLPGGHHWKIYVEVPSLHENAQDNLDWINSEIPIFNLIGKPMCIEKERYYDIDPSVQLVCKYLKAFKNRADKKKGINKLFNQKSQKRVSFVDDPNVSYDQCHSLLKEYMPAHVTANKVLQHLFIKYMERRCKFMEDYPGFHFNTGAGIYYDHKKSSENELKKMVNDKVLVKTKEAYYTNAEKLGELLMEAMLQEVDEFCKMDTQQNQEAHTHQQLIYEKGKSIKLLTVKPEKISAEKAFKLREIMGAEVPTMTQLLGREELDSYLSFALGVPLNKKQRLQDIDDAEYVLTLDYTVKMLNIHERRECGVPVIIQGETGVGKTALINMLSKLWNHALIKEWRAVKIRIIEMLCHRSSEQANNDLGITLGQLSAIWRSDKQRISIDTYLTEEKLIPLMEMHQNSDSKPYFKCVNEELKQLIDSESIFKLLDVDDETKEDETRHHNWKFSFNSRENSAVSYLIDDVMKTSSAQATAKLLCTILNGKLISTFHKLSVHAALSPKDIQNFFIPIVKLAEYLLKIQRGKKQEIKEPPVVTVFLDEVNTSSCMGLLKEIIIDKTFDGEPLPTNIFLVAACNPHRGNSLAIHENKKESWIRGTYYVQELHPTMRFLMWDYGSLNDEQELAYIKAKMFKANEDFTIVQNMKLSQLIVECQKRMRKYASEQLKSFGLEDNEAKLYATSCVSQRDIQRVFTFYEWIYNALIRSHTEKIKHPIITKQLSEVQMKHHALLVSLGLVYYMRLNSTYRERFKKELDKINYGMEFATAFMKEIDYYTDKLSLPAGIAKTEALKENLFATIICTVTKTPLIMVGAPGSSKTLSFNLTMSNLKGPESKQTFFRNEIFKSLDPHYYQCSRRTTSTEIETVFQHAINRQRSYERFSMPVHCVVFMDEAGLPEESHESLKVLHYHLDQQEVAFVAITNHILDAAKTNRAVSLFRPTTSQRDLETLAEGCLCSTPKDPAPQPKEYSKSIVKFCFAYSTIMRNECIERIFGLRDFIHFINYIRRKGKSKITSQLVLRSLERNFNGTKEFEYICSVFLKEMKPELNQLKKRNVIEILQRSLADKQLPSRPDKETASSHDAQNDITGKQTALNHDAQKGITGQQVALSHDAQKEITNEQTASSHDAQKEISGKQTASSPDTQNDITGKQTAQSHDNQNDITGQQTEVRYKLIIDPSEDESITRLLFVFGILKRENTRTYMCSNFLGDGQLQKINTIAAIRHSAVAGHTVILSQTDDIHESFYDLFNQNFRKIDDPETGNSRYFANISIGAHLKPSKVDLNFQCIVVVKESEINNTPAPFLNRFEKYFISHTNLLNLLFDKLPPCLKFIASKAYEKVKSFYLLLDPESFYGGKEETVCSLMLSILPKPGHCYTSPKCLVTTKGLTNEVLLLQNIVTFLHESGGFCYMENSLEELQHDAKCIISLLATTGSRFNGIVKILESCNHAEIFQWIVESLKLIYKPKDPSETNNDDDDGEYELRGASDEVCMVIAVITQWVVRFMCKKLMQLMTPEAAILKRKCIPISYFETYLNFQTHFSLKQLIEKHTKVFDQCNDDKIATKVICYTRSTLSIHQLPPVFASKSSFLADEIQHFKTNIEDLICKEIDNVFLCKLSSASSQTVFKSQLQQFVASQQQTTLVLVINMQETTNQIINHIRIMIEEVECTKHELKKLFFLLLHFPATMFYDPCYPSLFLCGWDHYYLDTIATDQIRTDHDQDHELSLVDIREWFRQSCLSSQKLSSDPDDLMLQALLKLLKKSESLLIIASRILFNIDSIDLTLDSTPDIVVRADYLKSLLFDKKVATNNTVATVLCLKFKSYWGPSVMGGHLEQAAKLSKSRESSLSVSDYVESMYRSTFFNFIAYMLYQISKSYSLDILFSSSCDNATIILFLKLLDVFPIPKLAEVKAFNNTWDCRIHAIGRTSYVPQFPFFVKVSTQICNMVEESMAKINQSIDLEFTETSHVVGSSDLQNKEEMFKKLYEHLCTEGIKEQQNVEENCLCTTAIKEMKNDERMWQKYYNDFTHYYLHLDATPDSLEYRLLHLTFTNTLRDCNEMKAIAAHCYLHLFQLDLAKVVASLKPLTQLHMLKLNEQPLYPKYSEDSLIAAVETSTDEFGTSKFSSCVSEFLINLLFKVLVNIITSEDDSYRAVSLQKWFNVYRDMMSAIDAAVLNEQIKAKCHLMEVTFLILLSFHHITREEVEYACAFACHLHAKHFTDDLQFKGSEPLNLKEIVTTFYMMLQNPEFSTSNSIPQFYQCVMEGIFTHFFPDTDNASSVTVYNKDDIEFFLNFANGQSIFNDVNQIVHRDTQSPKSICFSKLKLFLNRILCKGWTMNEDIDEQMTFYKLETCICVGQTILIQWPEAILSEYIPLYLQKITKKNQDNPLMNGTLIHLYFYNILDKLQTHQFAIPDLITMIIETEEKSTSKDSAVKLIALIEMQALLEELIYSVAINLENKTDFQMLLTMSDDLNHYIKDESHFDILLMHLIKKYNSLKTVMDLLEEKCKEPLTCLKSIKEKLEASPPSTSHQFPFVAGSPTAENEMYREICSRLQNTAGSFNSFLNYVKSIININDKRRSTVRMMIWLCVYYKFYCNKKSSPELIDFFNEAQEDLGLSKEHLNILRCFLDPERYMINEKETPNPSNFNAEVLEYTKEGNIVPKQPPSNIPERDPIWEFFVKPNKDPSDTDLRHALANMIAVVFGLPAQSTHLWYHMFAPKDLENSYLTGFMYSNKVKKGGLMYDCGCELNEDGNYGRSDYQLKSTLSLHSWYLLLWCNFGAFCIGLLTQPRALEQIRGHIISEWISIRHYCMAQLQAVWLYMRSNMSFGDEERSFFIMRSMYKLFMLFQQNQFPYRQGRFNDLHELNKYENSWHKFVYEPSKNSLEYELEKHSSDSVWALPVLKNFRILEQHYPHLATESDYMKRLNDDREANNCNPTHLFVLHQFTQEWRVLQIGGALLPYLVQFYKWIHTELSHLVTYQKAEQINIGTIFKLSAGRYSQDYFEKLTDLFNRVKRKYNEYLEINGGIVGIATCNRAARPTDVHNIDENTPLIKLISLKDTDKNDWLYIVIMDVITKHNTFLNKIFTHVETPDCHYKKYLPNKPSELHPTEITNQSCIVPSKDSDQNQFLKLISSHYVCNGTWSIDLKQLEQDVIEIYIAGKPLIAIDSIRTVFRFKNMPTEITQPGSSGGCAIDLSSIAQELPEEYKERLLDETSKCLEIEFRTEFYNTFAETVDGLRTVIGHLIQHILLKKGQNHTLNIKLSEFLKSFFNKGFKEIGIKSINETQQELLENIEMKRLFHCLELFVGWLQGGLYDFRSLPLSLFHHLKDEDTNIIMNMHTKYSSADMDYLLNELNELEKLLNPAEDHLTRKENLESSIIQLLRNLGLFDSTEKLISLIPETILVCHYVHFRMSLRKLKITVTAMIGSQPQKSLVTSNKWTEIIEDLWHFLPVEKHWYDDHCLRFDCVTLQFGDQEESDNDNETWPQQSPSDTGQHNDIREETIQPTDYPRNMTTAELCQWLSEKQIPPKYIKHFEQDEIDGSELAVYKDEHLKEFIPERRVRTRILVQFKKLYSVVPPSISPIAKQPSDEARNMTTTELCQWLREKRIPAKYVECFEKDETDGSELAEYEDEHLEEFIPEPRIRIKILVQFRKI